MEKRLFTSESVTEGHPDKICDAISDAILDALLEQDPMSRVACETCTTTGYVMVMGEITSNAHIDFQQVVRDTVREIGYDRAKYGFDADTCAVVTAIDKQSTDIAMGVDKALEAKEHKMSDEEIDAKLEEDKKVDYDRIGERMCAEMLYVNYAGNGVDKYVSLVTKAAATGKVLVLGCEDADAAKAALEVCKAGKPILNGANASNYEEMSKLATEAGVVLGVSGANIDELHDTVEAIEKLGNKNLVLDTTEATIKETFATTVQVRRASLKDTDRTFGYPSIVNLAKIAQGDRYMQQALLSLFTMKYGSIIVLEEMGYAEALPVFGLRQNVFTDPQKPMKVEPGIYPLNGADENSICLTTVDFALTYFLVSGELERSGVPVNLVINDAGGLSVLTSWAAGKFSGNSISKFFKENVEDKVKSRKVIIPGKVAVLKGDLEAKLPGWEIIVGPREAVQLVKFMKDLQANGEL